MRENSKLQSNSTKRTRDGFTLMELIISMGIFVIVALAALSIYIALLRVGQRTTALTRVQQEAQFVMSLIAKKIRTSRVDYSYSAYQGGTDLINGETELALIDLLDDEYVFKLSGDSITISINNGIERNVPATNISIVDLKFYINPSTNPFVSLEEPPSSQPYVTLVMEVSSSKGAQTASLIIQQTIPQRSGGVVQ